MATPVEMTVVWSVAQDRLVRLPVEDAEREVEAGRALPLNPDGTVPVNKTVTAQADPLYTTSPLALEVARLEELREAAANTLAEIEERQARLNFALGQRAGAGWVAPEVPWQPTGKSPEERDAERRQAESRANHGY